MNDKKAHDDIQLRYKELIPAKRFAELAHLLKETDVPPAEFIVRMAFKNYAEEQHSNRVKLFYIMKLKELTGIMPETETLKIACQIALEMGTPEVLESLAKRLEIGKNVFKELGSMFQKTYSYYVDEGRFVDLSIVMELTGIIPNEDMIHKGFRSYLEDCKFISFSGLKKRTGIKPDPEMIQEMYQQYQGQYLLCINKKDSETAESWLNRIKKLERLSKIKPEDLVV